MKTTFSNETAMNGFDNGEELNSSSTTTTTTTNEAIIAIDEVDSTNPSTAKYLAAKRVLPVTAGQDPMTTLSYEKYIVRFDQGTAKTWLNFLQEWEELKTQLNLTSGPALYNNFKTLLKGDALDKWTEVVTTNGTQTVDHFNQCIHDMTMYVFPKNALSTQQAYLSNQAKKPDSLTWRQYNVKLHQENSNLSYYPPNFDNTQKLPDAVLMGMVHRTAPNYFKEQVKTQGFGIQTKTTKELIQFFETRCEPVYHARLAKQVCGLVHAQVVFSLHFSCRKVSFQRGFKMARKQTQLRLKTGSKSKIFEKGT